MTTGVDNDVLFKGACYRLLSEFRFGDSDPDDIGVLGAARYVVASLISRGPVRSDREAIASEFDRILAAATVLEPTASEQTIAADFQLRALELDLQLDAGESQLCAICIERDFDLLVTGDKQAIRTIEKLHEVDSRMGPLRGRMRCLEQLVLELTTRTEARQLREKICREPDIDITLTICFSCLSPGMPAGGPVECLRSYIEDLRSKAPNALSA